MPWILEHSKAEELVHSKTKMHPEEVIDLPTIGMPYATTVIVSYSVEKVG